MSNGKSGRRSIFGPLLLITLGTVLLLAEFRPDLPVWEWVMQYWPVLLIVWGVAKLFDYFSARQAGEAGGGLTGGEVFLLLLILFFGASLSGVNWLRTHGPDLDIGLGPFDRRFSFPSELPPVAVRAGAPLSFKVHTERGDIDVRVAEAREIRVGVNKNAGAMNEEEARKRAESVRVEVRETGEGYEVLPVADSGRQRGVRVDLNVQVPQQTTLRAKTERGSVRLAGVGGPVTIEAARGEVEVRDAGGNVETELGRGDARIFGARGNVRITGRGSEIEISDIAGEVHIQGEFFGPIRVKNAAGGARFVSRRTDLTIPALPGRMEVGGGDLTIDNATRGVDLVTRDKDIRIEQAAGRIRIQNRRGNVSVRFREAPREEIDIQNESGSLELILPAGAEFEISASARNGDIENGFAGPELKSTQDHSTSTLEGKIGARGPRITLRTTYGSISLRKGP
jgi:DUF4097 and DUF4098 domain-containing protein YvlB